MSLQFIFGNSGAGKSHHLYKEVVTESLAYPDTNYIVLVPEQFTMQTQKDLYQGWFKLCYEPACNCDSSCKWI